ncbi:hypothetical protein C8Q77DRAFT_1100354 [Trametes polyzona]|nr:hypothetical protein C8Q77DRAFT_1100354 [Trametes polyzona]
MKSLSTALVSTALFVAAANAQFQIFTPRPPTQCIPTQLNWQGGTRAIVPGGQPQAAALQQYANLQGTSFTWATNISAGTSINFALTDQTGATAQTAPVDIQPGPDSSCLNGQSSGSSSTDSAAASSGSATAPGASSTAAGATTGSSTASGAATTSGTATSGGSSTASGTRSASGTSGSTSPSSSPNAAAGNVASAGVVGILGAVAAAILA